MSLDFTPEEFRAHLRQACDIVADLYTDLDQRPAYHGKEPSEVRAMFNEALPRDGADMQQLLQRIQTDVYGAATINVGPNFFSYILGSGNQAGMIADVLSTAINLSPAKWHLCASGTEIERTVLRWIAEFIGYPTDCGGVLVSGGTVANLTALTAARRQKAPFDIRAEGTAGGPPLTVYTSAAAHACMEKSLDLLGLGMRNVRKVPVQDDDTINLVALEQMIEEDRAAGMHPICIVGNAGTVNSGAVDPLDALADIAAKYDLWFHVDGAYGAPAAATESCGHLFRGIGRADSVALDPHKWLYVPLEAGCTLVRNPDHLRQAFSLEAPYLVQPGDDEMRVDFMDSTFQLTRSFRALKAWVTFKAYGADRLRDEIEANMDVMRHLAELIEDSDDFELIVPQRLSIVCFRYHPSSPDLNEEGINALNRELLKRAEADGRVFIAGTMIGDRLVIRVCCVNHRVERSHVERLLRILRELGEREIQESVSR